MSQHPKPTNQRRTERLRALDATGDTFKGVPVQDPEQEATKAIEPVRSPRRCQPKSQRSREERVQTALATIGAWSDLDVEEMLDALDRIKHESKPTPPIDLDWLEEPDRPKKPRAPAPGDPRSRL